MDFPLTTDHYLPVACVRCVLVRECFEQDIILSHGLYTNAGAMLLENPTEV